MLKKLRTKHTLSILASLTISTAGLHAQAPATVYWGAGHYNSLVNDMGRFTQDVNGSIVTLGWTLDQAASHPSATWSNTTTGVSEGTISQSLINDPDHPAGLMTSPSISTGAAIFDSEVISQAIGDTITPQGASLFSPILDLSSAAGQYVTIQFYTNFINHQTESFVVELSTTGGTTYQGVDILERLGKTAEGDSYNGWVRCAYPNRLSNIPLELINCRLRFRYNGNYYFFAVDDLTIMPTVRCDTTVNMSFSATSTISSGNDGSITTQLTGGVEPYNYTWTGPNSFTSNEANLSNLFPGTYTITATDSCGMTRTKAIVVESSVGINKLEEEAFKVYPNPSNGLFTVQMVNEIKENYTLTVMDLSGRVLFQTRGNEATQIIDLTTLTSGSYLLTIASENFSKTTGIEKK